VWSCYGVLLLVRFVVWFTVSFSIRISSIVTRLQTGQLKVLILALQEILLFSDPYKSAVEHCHLLLNANQCSFSQVSSRGMELTPHLNLVLWVKWMELYFCSHYMPLWHGMGQLYHYYTVSALFCMFYALCRFLNWMESWKSSLVNSLCIGSMDPLGYGYIGARNDTTQ